MYITAPVDAALDTMIDNIMHSSRWLWR